MSKNVVKRKGLAPALGDCGETCIAETPLYEDGQTSLIETHKAKGLKQRSYK
jgi:hypothetical protein